MSTLINDNQCKRRESTVNFCVNILTHCTFLLAIIGSVFFLFTEKIMSKAINEQIIDVATSNIDKIYYHNSYQDQRRIQDSLKFANLETLLKIYQAPNDSRFINNSWIEKLIYTVIGLLVFVVIIAFLTTKAHCGKISLLEILSENIIIFACVGVVEFLFFTKIIIKYIPDYPSSLSKVFVEQLKAYSPPTSS